MLECIFFFSFFEEEWKHTSAHWWQCLISSQSKTCKWTARTQLSELFITGRWRKGSHRTKCLQGERIRTTCYVPLSPHTHIHTHPLPDFVSIYWLVTNNYCWNKEWELFLTYEAICLSRSDFISTCVWKTAENSRPLFKSQLYCHFYCHFSVCMITN